MSRNKHTIAFRLLCLFIAVAAIMTATACSGATATVSPTPGVTGDNFNETGFPIVNSPITVKIGVFKMANHGDFATMKVVTDYEAKTNVHVEWEEIPGQGFAENVSLMLAGGTYPDAFLGRGLSANYDAMYGPSGRFVALNDLVKQYSPNVMKMFGAEPLAWEKTAIDGNIYSLPKVENVYHMQVEDKFYINKVWLDKLKLAVPTTLDEFRTVMTAFRDQDPNGNGKRDEIPFTTWLGYYGLGSLYGSFGVVDNQFSHMMVTDGKLTFVPATEGYKNGLAFWKQMYDEGILFSESFTLSNEQLNALGQNPEVILGSFIRHIGDYVVGPERYFDYVALPPLKGPDGTQMWKNTEYPFFYSSCFILTDKCKYQKEMMRWVDYFFTEQGALEFNAGPENVTWKWNDAEKASYSGIAPPTDVGFDDWRNGNCPGGMSLAWISKELYKKAKPDPSLPDFNYDAHTDVNLPFQAKEYVPVLNYTKAEADELSLIQGTIWNYVREWEGKFVTGQADLTEWDSYVAELQNMGVTRLTEIFQQAYDRLMNNKQN
jgi:putative aldouronate transport system substrate-binding protein